MKKMSIIVSFLFVFVGSAPCFAATILSNGVLYVGLSDSGTLNALGVGIQHVQYAGADYVFPEDPFHYYSLGVDGYYASNISPNDMDITATTTGATTTGAYRGLSFVQTISLVGGSIHFQVVLHNVGQIALTNVAFATGFDPDQDANLYSSLDTTNTVTSGAVMATGPVSGASIAILGDGRGGISSDWDTNPYAVHNDGHGDHAISMSWIFDRIDLGETRTINFSYAVTPSAVPIPTSVLLLGSGMLGVFGLRRMRGDRC